MSVRALANAATGVDYTTGAAAAAAMLETAERWVVTVPLACEPALRLASGSALHPLAVADRFWMSFTIDRLSATAEAGSQWAASLRLLCGDLSDRPVALHLADYGALGPAGVTDGRRPLLRVEEGYDWYRRPYLTVATGDNRIGLRVVEHPFVALADPEPGIDDERVVAFSRGEGSAYFRGGEDGRLVRACCRLARVDTAAPANAYHGILRTADGSWPVRRVDVYRDIGAEWDVVGAFGH